MAIAKKQETPNGEGKWEVMTTVGRQVSYDRTLKNGISLLQELLRRRFLARWVAVGNETKQVYVGDSATAGSERPLHDGTLGVLLAARLDAQSNAGGFGKGLVDTPVPHGGALEVAHGLDATRDVEALVVVDHGFLLALRAVGRARSGVLLLVRVFSQVALQGHEDQLHAGAILLDLANPFALYVF